MQASSPSAGPPHRWSEAGATLLRLIGHDLDHGLDPSPLVAAFAGDDPVGMVAVRSFGPRELVDALVEPLALLLPLGADRLALALPGRAWSLDDPIPPVSGQADLRTHVVVLAMADSRDGPCRIDTELHPLSIDEGGWRWEPRVALHQPPEAEVLTALATLLDVRDDLTATNLDDETHLATQLARVLLRGHEVALSPRSAGRLEAATVGRASVSSSVDTA